MIDHKAPSSQRPNHAVFLRELRDSAVPPSSGTMADSQTKVRWKTTKRAGPLLRTLRVGRISVSCWIAGAVHGVRGDRRRRSDPLLRSSLGCAKPGAGRHMVLHDPWRRKCGNPEGIVLCDRHLQAGPGTPEATPPCRDTSAKRETDGNASSHAGSPTCRGRFQPAGFHAASLSPPARNREELRGDHPIAVQSNAKACRQRGPSI